MHSNKLENYCQVKCIQNWADFNELYESHFHKTKHESQCSKPQQWIFRGQENSKWGLKPSIERKMEDFRLDKKCSSSIESGLLRRFKRQCHHYVPDVPKGENQLEWLTLMQHHFAPTRLLDWTYSVFVALYFAVEKSKKCNSTEKYHCAVWAFNTEWMKEPFKDILKDKCIEALLCWEKDREILKPRTFKELFFRRNSPIALVGAVTPQRLNQRINIQQGVFLCQGDISKKFEENFIEILSKNKDESEKNFIKLVFNINLENRKDILLHLHRMNINRATLFPGLDGFSESLGVLMANHELLLNPGSQFN